MLSKFQEWWKGDETNAAAYGGFTAVPRERSPWGRGVGKPIAIENLSPTTND